MSPSTGREDLKPLPLVPGTLDMLLLQILTHGPMHGHGLSLALVRLSRGTFVVDPGSLVPALRRLQLYGYVRGEWRRTDAGRRARWYTITHVGFARLNGDTQVWRAQSNAISLILALKAAPRAYRGDREP